MADLGTSTSTTTDLVNAVENYKVDVAILDLPTSHESFYDFNNAQEYLDYYKKVPHLKRPIDALVTYTIGQGLEVDNATKTKLELIRGAGESSFIQILKNLLREKKIQGDSFAEIVRDGSRIINLKPIWTGNMKIKYNKKGIITGYAQVNSDGNVIQEYETYDIFHLSNNRIANEMHGTSVVEACKWVLDALNEAMQDKRMIEHRNRALGIVYYDTNDAGEISYGNQAIENGIASGDMIGLMKGAMEITEFPNKSTGDTIQWIQYLESVLYRIIGVPRVIATSEGFTEAGSKVGYMTFDPVWTEEQVELEEDIWAQLGYRVKFTRPPSLNGLLSESDKKNTGQVGFQPNEVTATAGRNE